MYLATFYYFKYNVSLKNYYRMRTHKYFCEPTLACAHILLRTSYSKFVIHSNFSAYICFSSQIVLCKHNFYAYAQTLWHRFHSIHSNFIIYAHISMRTLYRTDLTLTLIITGMDLQVREHLFCNSNSSILVVSNRPWPKPSVGLHSAGSF